MNYTRPSNHNLIQLQRLGRRAGIFHTFIDPEGNFRGQDRPATDNERMMWSQLIGHLDTLTEADGFIRVPTILKEFWFQPDGPITMNAEDFSVLQPEHHAYTAETQREFLLRGHMGVWKGQSLYISRLIPPGYYMKGAPPPATGMTEEVFIPLMRSVLHPFMISGGTEGLPTILPFFDD